MIPRPSPFHPRPTHRRRAAAPLRAGVAAVLIAVSVALTGCTPGAAPKPTPTPLFTSEADAFRAAERVFRQFVTAKNRTQNGDESVDPQKYLAGPALEDDIRSLRDDRSSGTHIEGTSTVVSFELKQFDSASRTVDGLACLDVSKSRLVGADGHDLTPPNRPPVVAVGVKLAPVKTEMRIIRIEGSADSCR